MLQSLELGQVPATVQVYKMYNVPKINFPSCAAEGRAMKARLLLDIIGGAGRFKKTKGDASHPLGYVIHLHLEAEGEDAVDLYGVSVKSASDAWNSRKGLRLAWDDLKESLRDPNCLRAIPNFKMSPEDYQQLLLAIGI